MNKTIIAVAVIVASAASALAQRQVPQEGTAVRASGTLQPGVIVDVTSGIRGRIQKLLPGGDWGASVKKGDALAEIDPRTFQADLTIARASLVEAEAGSLSAKAQAVQVEQDLERAKESRATGGTSQAELDKYRIATEVAKAKLAVADAKVARSKAVLARAQLDLDACTIRSPTDGVIIDRRVNVGQVVSENVSVPSLFLIAGDLKKLQVWAAVKEADITRVAKGQAATFAVDAFPKETFKGRVSQIRLNARLLKDQVIYTVVIDVDNRDGRLMPYVSAEVTIEGGERR
jgi:HlyD family secretion protein